jgi:hypothetical protein
MCNPGYVGETCEKLINYCAKNPCLNEGTCVNNANGFFCKCKNEWTGTFCDVPKKIVRCKPGKLFIHKF